MSFYSWFAPPRTASFPETDQFIGQPKAIERRDLLSPDGENLLLVLGAPRSGTSWIGKLFDSHPDVLYRHEPDTVVRYKGRRLPLSVSQAKAYRERARNYLTQLANVRTLKPAGSLPQFAKRYRTPSGNAWHKAMVFGGRALDLAGGGPGWPRRIQIPDLIAPGKHPALIVIKSVSSLAQAGVLVRAMPKCRVLFVLRHPCGHVNSILRGVREGRFEHPIEFEDALGIAEAQEAGLSRALFASLDAVEQCAWHWAILNQKAANDLAGLRRISTIRYADVCMQPLELTRQLFDFAGLPWNEQTEAFVERSSWAAHSYRYYSVLRDSIAAANKWKHELSVSDQARILAVTRRVPVGELFLNEHSNMTVAQNGKESGERKRRFSSETLLFISSNFPPVIGGSSVVYDQICRNAAGKIIALGAKRDHETGRIFGGMDEHDAACGYEIHRIKYLRPPQAFKQTSGLRRWAGLVFVDLPLMGRVLVSIARLLIRNRIQTVCIGELVSLGWLVLPLRYLFGRTVIIYTHGEEIAHKSKGLAARLRRFYLSRANGIVSVSLFCKSLIVSRFDIDPARIAVIANGVDLHEFDRTPPDETLPTVPVRSQRTVLAVCRLVERKGLDRLIAAMPKVLAAVLDVHCIIVGEGPLAGELADRISRERLDDHVFLAGKMPLAELAELYRTADVFALPCRTLPDGDTEGFGLVFLEAGACGKPVVAGAAGGTIEAVIDGETGLVVNGDDPAEIADAIIRVLTDSRLATRLGEAGWRRAQEFGWTKAAAAFLSFALDERSQQTAVQSYPDANEHAVALAAPARLVVTVDVEEGFDWSTFSRRDFVVDGLHQLEAFQTACHSLGVSPVYLQTWSVLGDADFSAWFRKLLAQGLAETGTHLHGWTTPPFWEEPNVFNSYQCNLPESMERRKLEALTRRFSQALGVSPLIHRAGRWGGSARTARLLGELGYRVDLSPSARYRDNRGAGPDFQNIDGRPFWSDAEREVLVVPASSLKFGRGPEWISDLRRRIRGRGAEVAEIEGTAVRFSSEGRSLGQLKSMARQFSRRGDPVLVLSIHSSSLVVGGNPYSRGKAAAAANLERTRALLAYCIDELGMRPTSCASLFDEARAFARASQAWRHSGGAHELAAVQDDAAFTPA